MVVDRMSSPEDSVYKRLFASQDQGNYVKVSKDSQVTFGKDPTESHQHSTLQTDSKESIQPPGGQPSKKVVSNASHGSNVIYHEPQSAEESQSCSGHASLPGTLPASHYVETPHFANARGLESMGALTVLTPGLNSNTATGGALQAGRQISFANMETSTGNTRRKLYATEIGNTGGSSTYSNIHSKESSGTFVSSRTASLQSCHAINPPTIAINPPSTETTHHQPTAYQAVPVGMPLAMKADLNAQAHVALLHAKNQPAPQFGATKRFNIVPKNHGTSTPLSMSHGLGGTPLSMSLNSVVPSNAGAPDVIDSGCPPHVNMNSVLAHAVPVSVHPANISVSVQSVSGTGTPLTNRGSLNVPPAASPLHTRNLLNLKAVGNTGRSSLGGRANLLGGSQVGSQLGTNPPSLLGSFNNGQNQPQLSFHQMGNRLNTITSMPSGAVESRLHSYASSGIPSEFDSTPGTALAGVKVPSFKVQQFERKSLPVTQGLRSLIQQEKQNVNVGLQPGTSSVQSSNPNARHHQSIAASIAQNEKLLQAAQHDTQRAQIAPTLQKQQPLPPGQVPCAGFLTSGMPVSGMPKSSMPSSVGFTYSAVDRTSGGVTSGAMTMNTAFNATDLDNANDERRPSMIDVSLMSAPAADLQKGFEQIAHTTKSHSKEAIGRLRSYDEMRGQAQLGSIYNDVLRNDSKESQASLNQSRASQSRVLEDTEDSISFQKSYRLISAPNRSELSSELKHRGGELKGVDENHINSQSDQSTHPSFHIRSQNSQACVNEMIHPVNSVNGIQVGIQTGNFQAGNSVDSTGSVQFKTLHSVERGIERMNDRIMQLQQQCDQAYNARANEEDVQNMIENSASYNLASRNISGVIQETAEQQRILLEQERLLRELQRGGMIEMSNSAFMTNNSLVIAEDDAGPRNLGRPSGEIQNPIQGSLSSMGDDTPAGFVGNQAQVEQKQSTHSQSQQREKETPNLEQTLQAPLSPRGQRISSASEKVNVSRMSEKNRLLESTCSSQLKQSPVRLKRKENKKVSFPSPTDGAQESEQRTPRTSNASYSPSQRIGVQQGLSQNRSIKRKAGLNTGLNTNLPKGARNFKKTGLSAILQHQDNKQQLEREQYEKLQQQVENSMQEQDGIVQERSVRSRSRDKEGSYRDNSLRERSVSVTPSAGGHSVNTSTVGGAIGTPSGRKNFHANKDQPTMRDRTRMIKDSVLQRALKEGDFALEQAQTPNASVSMISPTGMINNGLNGGSSSAYGISSIHGAQTVPTGSRHVTGRFMGTRSNRFGKPSASPTGRNASGVSTVAVPVSSAPVNPVLISSANNASTTDVPKASPKSGGGNRKPPVPVQVVTNESQQLNVMPTTPSPTTTLSGSNLAQVASIQNQFQKEMSRMNGETAASPDGRVAHSFANQLNAVLARNPELFSGISPIKNEITPRDATPKDATQQVQRITPKETTGGPTYTLNSDSTQNTNNSSKHITFSNDQVALSARELMKNTRPLRSGSHPVQGTRGRNVPNNVFSNDCVNSSINSISGKQSLIHQSVSLGNKTTANKPSFSPLKRHVEQNKIQPTSALAKGIEMLVKMVSPKKDIEERSVAPVKNEENYCGIDPKNQFAHLLNQGFKPSTSPYCPDDSTPSPEKRWIPTPQKLHSQVLNNQSKAVSTKPVNLGGSRKSPMKCSEKGTGSAREAKQAVETQKPLQNVTSLEVNYSLDQDEPTQQQSMSLELQKSLEILRDNAIKTSSQNGDSDLQNALQHIGGLLSQMGNAKDLMNKKEDNGRADVAVEKKSSPSKQQGLHQRNFYASANYGSLKTGAKNQSDLSKAVQKEEDDDSFNKVSVYERAKRELMMNASVNLETPKLQQNNTEMEGEATGNETIAPTTATETDDEAKFNLKSSGSTKPSRIRPPSSKESNGNSARKEKEKFAGRARLGGWKQATPKQRGSTTLEQNSTLESNIDRMLDSLQKSASNKSLLGTSPNKMKQVDARTPKNDGQTKTPIQPTNSQDSEGQQGQAQEVGLSKKLENARSLKKLLSKDVLFQVENKSDARKIKELMREKESLMTMKTDSKERQKSGERFSQLDVNDILSMPQTHTPIETHQQGFLQEHSKGCLQGNVIQGQQQLIKPDMVNMDLSQLLNTSNMSEILSATPGQTPGVTPQIDLRQLGGGILSENTSKGTTSSGTVSSGEYAHERLLKKQHEIELEKLEKQLLESKMKRAEHEEALLQVADRTNAADTKKRPGIPYVGSTRQRLRVGETAISGNGVIGGGNGTTVARHGQSTTLFNNKLMDRQAGQPNANAVLHSEGASLRTATTTSHSSPTDNDGSSYSTLITKEIIREIKSYQRPDLVSQKYLAVLVTLVCRRPDFLDSATNWLQIKRCFSNVTEFCQRASQCTELGLSNVQRQNQLDLKKKVIHYLRNSEIPDMGNPTVIRDLGPAMMRVTSYIQGCLDLPLQQICSSGPTVKSARKHTTPTTSKNGANSGANTGGNRTGDTTPVAPPANSFEPIKPSTQVGDQVQAQAPANVQTGDIGATTGSTIPDVNATISDLEAEKEMSILGEVSLLSSIHGQGSITEQGSIAGQNSIVGAQNTNGIAGNKATVGNARLAANRIMNNALDGYGSGYKEHQQGDMNFDTRNVQSMDPVEDTTVTPNVANWMLKPEDHAAIQNNAAKIALEVRRESLNLAQNTGDAENSGSSAADSIQSCSGSSAVSNSSGASSGIINFKAQYEPSSLEIRPNIFAADFKGDLSSVKDVVVSKPGIGSIAFTDTPVDLSNIKSMQDLESKISFTDRCVSLYPGFTGDQIPPRGVEFNRFAYVTLLNCFPKKKMAAEKVQKEMRKMTTKIGGVLISYDVTTGIWMFSTEGLLTT